MNGNDIEARCYGYEPATSQLKELKTFIKIITLDLQKHRSLSPIYLDNMFQQAYRLYTKYNVEKE